MGGFKTFTTPKDLPQYTWAKIYYRATDLRGKANYDSKSLFYTKSTLLVFSSNNQQLSQLEIFPLSNPPQKED